MTLSLFSRIKKYVLYNREKAFTAKIIANKFSIDIKTANKYLNRLVQKHVLYKYEYGKIRVFVVLPITGQYGIEEVEGELVLKIFK